MPVIFTVMTEGATPPLSPEEVSSATYYTVDFIKGAFGSRVAREGKGMDVGQLFSLERDLAREVWADSRCEAIKELFL